MSVFSSVMSNEPPHAADLWQVICDTQNGKYRERVEAVRKESDKKTRNKLKCGLPCFTPSGTFRGKKAEDVEKHSGFICIDLDAKDNAGCEDFADLKKIIWQCPSIAFCARSVGGSGFFCLVPIADPKKHRDYFRALCADFAACGLKVDSSGADVSR